MSIPFWASVSYSFESHGLGGVPLAEKIPSPRNGLGWDFPDLGDAVVI
jgi:hypothetical protein